MDSLDFMLWAALRYDDDRFVFVVLLTLIGSQDPGGQITKTQEQIGAQLGYSRGHIARVLRVLEDDGVLRRIQRGVYQLNPAASLRGGLLPEPKGKSGTRRPRPERVEQLDLLRQILEDPDAPEAFRAMAAPGAELETSRGTTKTKKGRETS